MLKQKLFRLGVPMLAAGMVAFGVAGSAGGAALNPGQANKVSNGYLSALKYDAALHKLLPASIKSKGYILVGAQMENAPDDFFSGSSQSAVGFEVNMAKGIGKVLGVKIKYLQLPNWDSIVPSVQDGRVNMSMTAMNDTTARQQLINFIDYLTDGVGILVKAGNPENITGPSGLCGKNVTDVAGTTQEAYLDSLNAAGGICASNQITEVIAPSTAQEIINLTTGRADAILNDNITDAYDQQTNPAVYSVPYKPIDPGPYGIGFAKTSGSLEKAVQGAMLKLMAGGSSSVYMKILTAWNVASVAIPYPTINGCSTTYAADCNA
jgi:polar amino acid transport system substrate-binding protein